MQFDGAGTPRVEISTDRSRSDKVTVMPAADPCETTFVTVKMDNISSMCSPDHHKAPPTRTTDLKSPETSTRVEQPSRFSQDGACSSSSSTCAEAEHSNAHSQSGSELDWDDSDSAGRIEDEMSGGSSGEDTMAAQGRVSNSTNESSKTCNGHSAHLQVSGKLPTMGTHSLLLSETPVGAAPLENGVVQPAARAPAVGSLWWILGQQKTIKIVALGMLALGMWIGVLDRRGASALRAPTTALTLYGQPVERHTARSTTLGGNLDLQVLVVDHMRIVREMMLQMQEAWPVLAAVAAQEDHFSGRVGSSWPRLSGPTEPLLASGDLYVRTFDRPSFTYRRISEELMHGPWV